MSQRFVCLVWNIQNKGNRSLSGQVVGPTRFANKYTPQMKAATNGNESKVCLVFYCSLTLPLSYFIL